MDTVELDVLGTFRLHCGGQTLADMATDNARAMLTFLALEGIQPRTSLAALLWPYLSQEAAFDNLRKTLYRLRQRLEATVPDAASLLITSRLHVQLDPQRLAVDVLRFQTLLADADYHAHESLATCDGCLQRLADAIELYQGDLLAGLELGDAPAFWEWLMLRRETLQHQMLLTLARLTEAWDLRGDFARALAYCSRSLEIDPLREETQRWQMRLLVRLGQQSQALQHYERFRGLLLDQLSVEPEPTTVALYEQIRRGDLLPLLSKPQPIPAERPAPSVQMARVESSNAFKLGDVPETGRIYGREAELAQVKEWLSAERAQLVVIVGIGGMGKSTLAAASAQATAADFDQVIWRSLVNAPPVDELLRGVLMSLAQQPVADLPFTPPSSLDEQLALLLNELRRQRCLLVLDNLESILQPEGIGQMRAGYDGYMQLLRRLAENRHNSCLLLTSRERPQGMARWEEDLPRIHSLQLGGLDATAGQAILTARGLGGKVVDGHALVARYSGHPLALKLVTETIQDLFAGDIRAFLASDAVIFDDIRMMLDQQFARLSDLEREILIWLAIEREAISLQTLRNNLLQSPTPQAVLESVRSLLRRSLLERSGSAVTLQNVITEYTTAYLVERVCQEIESGVEPRIEPRIEQRGAPNLPFALLPSFLNRFALLKAQAKEYVRQSQTRLILLPLAERLEQRLGMPLLQSTLRALLDRLRAEIGRAPSYAGGNLLNLVRQLGFNLDAFDFSRLSVWQADFRDLLFAPINLAHADLSRGAFTLTFDLRAIRFSTNGEILVTGIVEGEICLWRAAGGQLHHAFHSINANASVPVIISQNDQWLVSGGQNHVVCIWSAENGNLLHTFAGHTEPLYALAMSDDGLLVASSSRDSTIRIWDVARGEVRHLLIEHADAINGLAFHPDGKILAGGGGERSIRLWDTESGRLLQTLSGHVREIECLAFSRDGKLLISGIHDGTIGIWDVASGQLLHTLEAHGHIVRSLLVHSDNRLLASGGADRLVRLWDLQSGELLHTFIGHTNEVKSLAFSADGLILASGGADNVVQLWDTQSGHGLDSLKGHADMVYSIRFNPAGTLLASSGLSGLARLWDIRPIADSIAAQGQVMQEPRIQSQSRQGHVGAIRVVAFHPKGRLFASGGGDQLIQVWDVESSKPIRTLRGHTNTIKALAFSPDGRWLASGGSDRVIRLWPMDDVSAVNGLGGRLLQGHKDDISALAFSPDGRTLATSSLDHTARLWDIDSGRELHLLAGHPYGLSCIAFNPDGKSVTTAGYDFSILSWDVSSGQRLERWREHKVSGAIIAFHPAGEIFACVPAATKTIEIRLVSSGALLHTLSGQTGTIFSLDFSPTEPILASSGWDPTIWLWNIESGTSLARLRAPGPYAGMNITGVTGITNAQKQGLKVLGAYEQNE